jgi:hypothetical protein
VGVVLCDPDKKSRSFVDLRQRLLRVHVPSHRLLA